MFYERFVALCKERGITPTKASQEIGISKGNVSFWHKQFDEGIDVKPNASTISKIADYFAVSVDYLLGINYTTESENKARVPLNQKITALNGMLSMSLYDIPVFNSVSAGFGVLTDDNVEEFVSLPFGSETEAEETICVRVKGDSMFPDIQDGDLVVVHRQNSVDSGDVAVVMVDDEAFIKRVTYGVGWVKLTSTNPDYGSVTYKGSDLLRLRVLGKAKTSFHNF